MDMYDDMAYQDGRRCHSTRGTLCSHQGTIKFEFKSPSVHSMATPWPPYRQKTRAQLCLSVLTAAATGTLLVTDSKSHTNITYGYEMSHHNY
ncbi:hypothetical protein E2C01_023523 [Portunus trituberculatus]|uniref:Uncharacterized protein n=1 Tax=Portunus trituberculatus TaxID=210409 RepID=A0A5B7E8F0_PORTR|nr:hypothetical protein [Portunus trituberculatus]